MLQYKNIKWTVLVYTLVLVIIGVFMATVVLNIAVQLSVEYDNRNIELSLAWIIKTKWDLSIKYSNELNSSGSGFTDILSCPTGITMSGSTLLTTWINTQIRFINDTVLCRWESVHGWNNLDIFFSWDFSDIEFAQYDSSQVWVNSWTLVATFGDSDTTTLTLPWTWYYSSDGIDDNFDSDNFSVSSTWATMYPDWYLDNDSDAKLLNYWYALEGSWLYNALWTNSKMKQYINGNTNNDVGSYQKIWNTSSWYLNVDINGDHTLYLYRIDPDVYDESTELVVQELITGTGQTWWVGYLQDDLSIASGTWSAYGFDFINNDYALFIENTWSWTLLYQITAESASTGNSIYINALDDSQDNIYSYLGSHLLVNNEWQLIGDTFEVFWLKEFVSWSVSSWPVVSTNTVEFWDWDSINNMDLTWFDTTWFSFTINDFSSDLAGTTYLIHEWVNRYMRVQDTWRIRIIARRDDGTVAVNSTSSAVNALLPNTQYDIELIVTNTTYSLLVDWTSILSWTITWTTNFNLPRDLNNIASISVFNTTWVTFRDGVGSIIFEENWDAASWNAKLTSWSVDDI